MLLAVGGESRRIVLGEVPPAKPEQEQEPAQDVAAQWRHSEGQGSSFPIPQPRQRTGKAPEARARGIGNRKSCRRRFRVSGKSFHSSFISYRRTSRFHAPFETLQFFFFFFHYDKFRNKNFLRTISTFCSRGAFPNFLRHSRLPKYSVRDAEILTKTLGNIYWPKKNV